MKPSETKIDRVDSATQRSQPRKRPGWKWTMAESRILADIDSRQVLESTQNCKDLFPFCILPVNFARKEKAKEASTASAANGTDGKSEGCEGV